MRDIIMNSKESMSLHPRWSGESTRTEILESSSEKNVGGEKGKPPAPAPVGFWDHRLKKTRVEVLKAWMKTSRCTDERMLFLLISPALILSVFILGVLSMYWAVLSHVNENVSSLTIFVVDFDGMAPYTTVVPQIGPFIVQATEQRLAAPKPHLGYETVSREHFANDPMNVRQEIFDQKAWAAIIINANATALLQRAVETGNTSYDPLGACQIIWVEARDEDTIHAHVGPELQSLAASLTAQFGARWTQQVLRNNSIPNNNLEAAPQALSPAIGFSIFNLRPFDPPVTVPAVTIGLIYLIIISFFSFAFYMPTHMKFLIPAGHPPLHFNQFIIYRWFATMAAYLSMSLFYSFISLAFQIPFNNPTAPGNEMAHNPNAYGAATFVVYWMINWIGMIALGLACENVAMIIGQPWTAMWLIFWVISNVATSFYALDLTPKFYYWGYAWPLHQSKLPHLAVLGQGIDIFPVVEASRSTLFDLHSRIGLNFGVLFAWAAVNSLFFPFCCYFMRWKTQRQKRKEMEAQKRKEDEQKGGLPQELPRSRGVASRKVS